MTMRTRCGKRWFTKTLPSKQKKTNVRQVKQQKATMVLMDRLSLDAWTSEEDWKELQSNMVRDPLVKGCVPSGLVTVSNHIIQVLLWCAWRRFTPVRDRLVLGDGVVMTTRTPGLKWYSLQSRLWVWFYPPPRDPRGAGRWQKFPNFIPKWFIFIIDPFRFLQDPKQQWVPYKRYFLSEPVGYWGGLWGWPFWVVEHFLTATKSVWDGGKKEGWDHEASGWLHAHAHRVLQKSLG